MIYGDRIRLRRLEEADLPKFVDWLNDPDVRAGVSMYLPVSSDEEKNWYEGMLRRPPDERILAIDIREGPGWRLIGSTSFFDFNHRNRNAEFGLLIGDKSIWNKGYGTEVTRLMLRHGFETLNLHRIVLRVFSTNPAARRVYEKAGYRLEGTMREADYRDGKYVDLHLMAVLQPEWTSGSGPDRDSDARTA
jgi:RimJ/RimL family protein N-acetyltransferase